MEAHEFDQESFFRAIAQSGTRALLIGRRAIIALGGPLQTVDYDFWLHIDDIDRFNAALAPFELVPNRTADEARKRGRYALENGERVDVLVARVVSTQLGEQVHFDDVWSRRLTVPSIDGEPGTQLCMPSIPDLIRTKQFGSRPKDADDIRFLGVLLNRLPK